MIKITELKDGQSLVEARQVLDTIWKRCQQEGFVGRCWGKRGKGSTSNTPGSNITLCDGNNVVVIYQHKGNKQLQVTSFGPRDSKLEKEVTTLLYRSMQLPLPLHPLHPQFER